MILVPTLWIMYGVILITCTNWDRDAVVLFLLSLPISSYVGIMATEAGMADFKDLRPHIMKLIPSNR